MPCVHDDLYDPNHPKSHLFSRFGSFFVYLERLKLESLNFVHRWAILNVGTGITNSPNLRGQAPVTHFLNTGPIIS